MDGVRSITFLWSLFLSVCLCVLFFGFRGNLGREFVEHYITLLVYICKKVLTLYGRSSTRTPQYPERLPLGSLRSSPVSTPGRGAGSWNRVQQGTPTSE